MIANHVPKVKFRTESFVGCAVTYFEVAVFSEVIDPDVFTFTPKVRGSLATILRISSFGNFF